MSPLFDSVHQLLKQLPGLGHRSAQRIALHLLVERPEKLGPLLETLQTAAATLHRCPITGNLTEADVCTLYANPKRTKKTVCIVETVADLVAMENSELYAGTYHVLHGKLSPLQGVGPEELFLAPLRQRLEDDGVEEIIFALPGDIEGNATCHYLQEAVLRGLEVPCTRIAFGLPSGAGLEQADSATLQNAFAGRTKA